jgi:hypothetical protein
LDINFGGSLYSLGDFNALNNNTYVIVNDASKITSIKGDIQIDLNTELLNFPNSAILDTTSRSYTNRNIKCVVNGTTYYIPLYN